MLSAMGRDFLPRKLVMVVAWLVATALAGVVAWTAVSRLGRDGTATTAARPLSPADVQARLSRTTAMTETPRPTPVPRTAGSAGTGPGGSSVPPQRSRNWQLTGGTVAVACRGSAIKVLYATPLVGWAYQVDPHPPGTVAVEFSDGQRTARLSAWCHNGAPAGTAGMFSGYPEGNGAGSDD